MNWAQIEGKWDTAKGKVREQWGKLTDDDLTIIKGKRDQLLGKIKERYGYTQEQADREIDSFMSAYGDEAEDMDSNRRRM
jgi:uncharacterized protein YjbJ (UPF0337 family)